MTGDVARYAIGLTMLLGWLLYFYLPHSYLSRSRRDGAAG